MRVEKSGNSGFTCVRDFLHSGLSEQVVTLRAADRRDVLDFQCPSEPQTVRLVRHIAPNGQMRISAHRGRRFRLIVDAISA
jgi:hypothetical protein